MLTGTYATHSCTYLTPTQCCVQIRKVQGSRSLLHLTAATINIYVCTVYGTTVRQEQINCPWAVYSFYSVGLMGLPFFAIFLPVKKSWNHLFCCLSTSVLCDQPYWYKKSLRLYFSDVFEKICFQIRWFLGKCRRWRPNLASLVWTYSKSQGRGNHFLGLG